MCAARRKLLERSAQMCRNTPPPRLETKRRKRPGGPKGKPLSECVKKTTGALTWAGPCVHATNELRSQLLPPPNTRSTTVSQNTLWGHTPTTRHTQTKWICGLARLTTGVCAEGAVRALVGQSPLRLGEGGWWMGGVGFGYGRVRFTSLCFSPFQLEAAPTWRWDCSAGLA